MEFFDYMKVKSSTDSITNQDDIEERKYISKTEGISNNNVSESKIQ